MTPDKTRELVALQVRTGSGYNRNAARLILAEARRGHGRAAVDRLIRELNLDEAFGLKPGTVFRHP